MLSGFTWGIICVGLIIFKYAFLLPKYDKDEYKMYEKRDQVALSVTNGEIDQDLEEYKYITQIMNLDGGKHEHI